LIRKTIKDRN